jgi:HD-GYP domain-containing protein (c-di-GMP phosphodiesterase class II)
MHDIGKIAVPGNIIRKPSKLTSDEMNLMRRHVGAGASLIEGLEVLENSTDIVQHHHENFDGTGYPSGLAGSTIPLGSRIVFVADAFDALTTDRPYRKGKIRSEALDVLTTNAGSQFDPRVVEALKTMLGVDRVARH